MPVPNREMPVSELAAGLRVVRDGKERIITSYQTRASNETTLTFDDGSVAVLEDDDTLEVPA